ncbi:MAG: hypothetical protein Q7S36_00650 [Candidatus Liptonbacteria bacterium]|nr:hypothetical protein [Candidatus Liptonbacteria bacterium]
MQVSAKAVLSAYSNGEQRVHGKFHKERDSLSVISKRGAGAFVLSELLDKLAKKGAKPGAKLRIVIEAR